MRTFCRECGGGAICEHEVVKYSCHICDPNSATAGVLRARIGAALRGVRKASSSTELLGCSIEECRQHLEEQFEDGMTWDNHGKDIGMWHIDHRRPCHSFNLLYEDEQRKCFHHTNLQPMWASENISKSDYFDEDSFEWEWTGAKWEPIE